MNRVDDKVLEHVHVLFLLLMGSIDTGFKYLEYILKPNNYLKEDWLWLLKMLKLKLTIGASDGFPLVGD